MSYWRAVLIRAAAIIIAVAALYSALVLARPIAVLLASVIIAVALEPLVERLERWLPRGLATVAVYATLVLIVFGTLTAIGVTVADQVQQAIDEAPSNREEVTDLINDYDPFGNGRLVDFLEKNRPSSSGLALQVPIEITSTIAEIVVAFFLSIYWVIAAPALRRFFVSLFPDDGKREHSMQVLDAMGQKMGGYVRAITLDGLVLGTVTFIGLSLIDVRFPIVLAIISGLSVLVPIIGPIASAIPAICWRFWIPGQGSDRAGFLHPGPVAREQHPVAEDHAAGSRYPSAPGHSPSSPEGRSPASLSTDRRADDPAHQCARATLSRR
ncbi:MAG: AI-2E family transporter [Thermomicrobiales bacterium]